MQDIKFEDQQVKWKKQHINPSVWSIEHCSSTRKLHLSWSNERWSFAALSYSFDYISAT